MRPILPVALAGLLLACGDLLTFTVEEQASATVEGAGALGAVLGTLELAGFEGFSVALEEELANQGVARGDIAGARLVRLVLTSPDGTLDFLDTLEVRVESPSVEGVRVAYVEGIPEGATEVALSLEDVDLAPYLEDVSLSLTTVASGSAPVEDTTVVADLAVEVTATPQGACNAAEGVE